ncbi:MAG: phosphoribosylamine--glycine ligase [Clostridiales bacterium]|jgi:phosphoribosylamine--glycine ligase|nr:phosphoribosylamine--glycine ligase [Clostridiales bacterium]
MKVLVVGGGGREHAIVWKLKENPEIEKIFCAPGNAGIAQIAECVNIKATDIVNMVKFAKENSVDFTVIGPDDPLSMGIVDSFKAAGLEVFGPNKAAAIIEYSKAYSKELMKKYGIPTAAYETFNNFENAVKYIKQTKHPLFIKADGLALGKGAVYCENEGESEKTLREMMIEKNFGSSGETVVIEEFMTGPEVTVLAFSDGKTIKPMVSSQDHKRVYDNDMGLNTGGMGAFSPSRFYTEDIAKVCEEKIFKPTAEALIKEGRPFTGIIYFGLMLTPDGPKVIEYNSRFGDPETQAVLPRLDTDLLSIFKACVNQTLGTVDIKWKKSAAACVVLASGGYPEKYETGFEIKGLENLENKENLYVFHAGTSLANGKTVTNGGRVLGIAAQGENLDSAVKRAYEGAGLVSFEGMHYRTDIGKLKPAQ